MYWKMLNRLLATAVIVLFWMVSAEACCSLGCCDCSCVAAKLNKSAPAIASSIQRNLGPSAGSVKSFYVDFSDNKSSARTWSCVPQPFGGALCTRP